MSQAEFGGAHEKIYASPQHRQAAFFARSLPSVIGAIPRRLTRAERLMIRQRIRDAENSTALSLSVKNFNGAPGPFRKPRRMIGLLAEFPAKGSKRAKIEGGANTEVDKLRWNLQSLAKAIHRAAEQTPWTKEERTDIRRMLRDATNFEDLSLTAR